MTTDPRARAVALLLAIIAPVGLLTACGDGDTTTTAPTTEAPTTEAPTTEAPTTEAPTTEAPTTEPPATEAPATEAPAGEAGMRIEIEFSEGSVVGGSQRVPIALGDEVTLVITADVADELHLHGYDLHADVEPAAPAELSFVADIPGVFEAELEDLGIPVIEIEVS